jgi:hypothetical protein
VLLNDSSITIKQTQGGHLKDPKPTHRDVLALNGVRAHTHYQAIFAICPSSADTRSSKKTREELVDLLLMPSVRERDGYHKVLGLLVYRVPRRAISKPIRKGG